MAQLKRMIEIGVDARKAQQGGKQVEGAMRGVRVEAKHVKDELERFEKKQGEVAKSSGALASAVKKIFATAAVVGAAQAIFKAFVSYENTLIDVQTTTGMTAEETRKLTKELEILSTQLPRSTSELAGLANAGSQLGVQGVDNLAKFAEEMARIGAVTDIKTGQQVIQLGRLLQASGEPIDGITALGATIDALGDKTGASANEILTIATGLASLGDRFDITSRQAVGIAAALTRVGSDSSAAGVAIGKLLGEFERVSEEGGPTLDLLSKVSGIASGDFKKSFETDAVGALQKFLAGMSQVRDEGGNLGVVLEALGINDFRLQKSLLPLISGHHILADAMKAADDEAGNLQGTFKDSELVFGSTESNITKAKNSFVALAATIGNFVSPAFTGLFTILNHIIKNLIGMDQAADFSWLDELSTALYVSVRQTGINLRIGWGEIVLFLKRIWRGFTDSIAVAFGAAIDGVIAKAKQLTDVLPQEAIDFFGIQSGVDNINALSKKSFTDVAISGSFDYEAAREELKEKAKKLQEDLARYILEQQDARKKDYDEAGRRIGKQFGGGVSDGAIDQLKEDADALNKALQTAVPPTAEQPVGEFAESVEELARSLIKVEDPAGQARESIAALVREMDNEISLLNKYGHNQEVFAEAFEKTTRVIDFARLAEEAYGVSTEQSIAATREYRDALDELADARRRAQGANELRLINEEVDRQITLFGKSRVERQNAAIIADTQAAAERQFGKDTEEASRAVEVLVDKLKLIDRMDAIQNIFDGVGDAVGNTFEDIVFDAENALDIVKNAMMEISRLVFQQLLTRQISGAISGALGGAFGGANKFGNVFSSGAVVPFADGGVVTGPTMFGMSNKRTGLMGEAGPEAILPLTRVGNKLGVASAGGGGSYTVTINVHGVRDARSFMESETQVARSFSRALRRVQ